MDEEWDQLLNLWDAKKSAEASGIIENTEKAQAEIDRFLDQLKQKLLKEGWTLHDIENLLAGYGEDTVGRRKLSLKSVYPSELKSRVLMPLIAGLIVSGAAALVIVSGVFAAVPLMMGIFYFAAFAGLTPLLTLILSRPYIRRLGQMGTAMKIRGTADSQDNLGLGITNARRAELLRELGLREDSLTGEEWTVIISRLDKMNSKRFVSLREETEKKFMYRGLKQVFFSILFIPYSVVLKIFMIPMEYQSVAHRDFINDEKNRLAIIRSGIIELKAEEMQIKGAESSLFDDMVSREYRLNESGRKLQEAINSYLKNRDITAEEDIYSALQDYQDWLRVHETNAEFREHSAERVLLYLRAYDLARSRTRRERISYALSRGRLGKVGRFVESLVFPEAAA
ncbi:MAG TPA: hypothetical protein VJC03_05360, partial [bacterium]|nr:hypothetical protein [bacterium]